MSEEREAKNEWITNENSRARFWATANELKLNKNETHNALNFVESAYDFTGTLDEALAQIAAYAELKARAVEKITEAAQSSALFTMAAQLPEAPALAWTKFQKEPGSPTWSLTLRAGLPPEQADEATREVLRQVVRAEKWMKENGYRPVYHGNEMAASPVPAPTQPQPPTKTKTQGTPPGKVEGEPVPPPPPTGAGGKYPNGYPLPPPPTGAGNGTPPPPTDGTPPAPEQKGNGAGSETTYTADSITALVSPNGNRYYAVRGGSVKRHGATAWPEVAAQLKVITDYDPANLEIGKPWDVSNFGIRVLATIPAGKQYPNKVVNFLPSTSA